MYNPRFGLGYVTQQRINAQLGAMRKAEPGRRPLSRDDAAALWRMLGVIAVVATGLVLAVVAAGGLQ